MKKKLILILSASAIMCFTLDSCKRKGCTDELAVNYDEKAKTEDDSCEYDENDTSTQSTDDHNEAQKEFDDVLSIAEDVMKSKDNQMDKSGATISLSDTTCATIDLDTSYSDNGAQGRITVDFGTTNCLGVDGRNRRGKIYIVYTGRYRTIGTKVTTTFDGYYVDDVKVEGTKVVETVSSTVFNVSVTGAKLTFTDNTTVTWESERTRTWTEGNSTIWNFLDDVYEIDGTASGVGRYGRNFDVSIDGITVKIECWFSYIFAPVSGTITVSPEGFDDRVLDYGDGTCDKKATLTIGNHDPIEYDWSN